MAGDPPLSEPDALALQQAEAHIVVKTDEQLVQAVGPLVGKFLRVLEKTMSRTHTIRPMKPASKTFKAIEIATAVLCAEGFLQLRKAIPDRPGVADRWLMNTLTRLQNGLRASTQEAWIIQTGIAEEPGPTKPQIHLP